MAKVVGAKEVAVIVAFIGLLAVLGGWIAAKSVSQPPK
jgi:hypothetical protein